MRNLPHPLTSHPANAAVAMRSGCGKLSDSARQSLRDAGNLSDFLDALEAILAQCANLDAYFINLYQAADNTMLCVRVQLPAALATLAQTYANYVFPAEGDNPNVVVLKEKTEISIGPTNLKDFPTSTRLAFERLAAHHMLFLPIIPATGERKAIGTLILTSQRKSFSAAAQKFFRQLLDEAAPLLRLHQALASWEKRALSIRDTEVELQSLLRFVAEMSNLTTNDEIYPRIQQEFLNRFDLDLAAILLAEHHNLRCVDTRLRREEISWGSEWQQHCDRLSYSRDIGDGATSSVYLNNHPIFFGNIAAVRNLEMSPQDRANLDLLPNLQSFGILPIRKQGNPIGVLWLGSVRRQNAISPGQLILAQHLCDFLGAVIESAHTYTLVEEQRQEIETLVSALQNRVEVLDQLASRDRLTGLYNFGSFEGELNKRLQIFRGQQHPMPLSLIMCDVDFFKRFNDTFGHVAGNAALQEVANRICRTVRDNDYVARYGGEEFSVLLGRCSIDAAARLAERIRETIAADPFRIDGTDHFVSISLGCAELRPSDDVAGFIARADTALYAAKQNGRNRVEIAGKE